MEIQIEQGIPLPRQHSTRFSKVAAKLGRMKIDQSILVDMLVCTTYSAIRQFAHDTRTRKKFTVRSAGTNNKSRIWRIS